MYSHNNQGPIQFVQVTDTHLFATGERDLLGVETQQSFEAVMSLVSERQKQIPADFFLLSGDLSQDGSVAAYQYLSDRLAKLNKPSFWFCGNHDNLENMQQVAKADELQQVIRSNKWQLVLLNSQVPGSVHGRLEQSQLDILAKALEERPDLYTLISFHHHPIDMQCDWLDNIGVHNSQELFDLIAPFDNVQAILWGHVHQELDKEINGVRMLASPSTCIQFKPEQKEFKLDDIAPGYRWLQLNDDGTIDTAVERAVEFVANIDHSAAGY